MPKYGIRVVIVLAVMLLLSAYSAVLAEIRHLGQARDFKSVSQQSQDKYLLTVARIKRLVDTGQCGAALQAFNQLKTDFPEIARPDSNDLDIFIEAEMLRCRGKFAKAARCYRRLLEEFGPEGKFYEAALDRRFRIATAFLAGEKKRVLGVFKMKGYAEGARIMEGIGYRVGLDDPIGIKATVAVAESYQERKKFDEAYHNWSLIQEQCKTDQVAKDALLAMARCKLAKYRGPEYDTSDLTGRPLNPESYYNSAKSCYEKFKSRYPKAEEHEIDDKLKLINEQLAFKQFKVGQYYQKRGNELSANLYYDMVIRDWPQTDAAKMAKEMLIKNSGSEEKKK